MACQVTFFRVLCPSHLTYETVPGLWWYVSVTGVVWVGAGALVSWAQPIRERKNRGAEKRDLFGVATLERGAEKGV